MREKGGSQRNEIVLLTEGIYIMKTMANKSKMRHQTDGLPGFSLAERDRRWDIGRKIMAENDLEALIVFGS
jgi:hypothetical protein